MGDSDHLSLRSWITLIGKNSAENFLVWSSRQMLVKTTYVIRHLVEKALHLRKLTPDIENEINYELTRLGHISDVDYEALELLMSEMDAGRIQLVPTT
jgi:hypothetical protein